MPLGLKLGSLVGYATPFAAIAIYLYVGGSTGPGINVTHVIAVSVFVLGLVSGVVSLARARRFETRWTSVAGWSIAFSLFGFPLLCGALIFLLFATGGFRIPGG